MNVKLKKIFSTVLLTLLAFSCIGTLQYRYGIRFDENYSSKASVAVFNADATQNISVIKTVKENKKTDNKASQRSVLVSGNSIGIALMTDGLVVTKVTEVKTNDKRYYPAADAGLRPGDRLLEFNDVKIENSEHISKLINENKNKKIKIKFMRNQNTCHTEITPQFDTKSNEYKIGVLVKDSASGIGTLTFVLPESNRYASLGHAITDSSTGVNLVALSGTVSQARINGIVKGVPGVPGELRGNFSLRKPVGGVEKNNEFGVYGTFESESMKKEMILMPVLSRDKIKVGDAEIICTLDENGPKHYSVKICKINSQSQRACKGLVIEITDEELLNITGGIVQGMSGSPIIQDDCIVGAVTHVMINDPKKGYGVFAEWMVEEAEEIPLKRAA